MLEHYIYLYIPIIIYCIPLPFELWEDTEVNKQPKTKQKTPYSHSLTLIKGESEAGDRK